MAGGETNVRRKVRECVVTPVVAETTLHEVPFVGVLMHRHQFDGGDAERLEVADGWFRRETTIRAAQRFGHVGIQFGEALDVQFVDEGLVPGSAWMPVVPPRERTIH